MTSDDECRSEVPPVCCIMCTQMAGRRTVGERACFALSILDELDGWCMRSSTYLLPEVVMFLSVSTAVP